MTLSTLERSGSDYNSQWKVWNISKNRVLNIKSKANAAHLFLFKDKKMFADFKDNQWSFYLNEFKADSKPFFKFPKMTNITLFKTFSHKEQIYLLLRVQNDSFGKSGDELYVYSPNKNTIRKIYNSKKPLVFIGQCENNFTFNSGTIINLSLSDKSAKVSTLPKKTWDNVASYRSDGQHNLIFSQLNPSHFYYRESNCRNFFRFKRNKKYKN